MKDDHINFGITIPPEIRKMFKSTLGWGAKAVDAIADRLVFRGFDNDNFNINEIFQLNSADILFDDAKLSALINSCSFIYISEGDDGFPENGQRVTLGGQSCHGGARPHRAAVPHGQRRGTVDPDERPTRPRLPVLGRFQQEGAGTVPRNMRYITASSTAVLEAGDVVTLAAYNYGAAVDASPFGGEPHLTVALVART